VCCDKWRRISALSTIHFNESASLDEWNFEFGRELGSMIRVLGVLA